MTDPALVFYVGNRNPSISQPITVDGDPYDLTPASGVRFRMRALGASTLKVDAAATIVGTPTDGNVQYSWAAGDVDTEGLFLCWWTVTVGGKDEDVFESLLEFRAHAPDSGWLCELAEVRLALELEPEEVGRDSLIRSLIPLASSRIIDYAESEFAPATASATRRFPVRHPRGGETNAVVDFAPFDLRSASAVVLNPESSSPLTLNPAIFEYALEPVSSRYGVYTRLRLGISASSSAWSTFAAQQGYALVDVTGAWGFATVPADARRACIATVCSWVDKAVSEYGISNLDTTARQTTALRASGYDLPNEARKAVDHFRERRVRVG